MRQQSALAVVALVIVSWSSFARAECCLTGRTWHDAPAEVNVPGMMPPGCAVIEVFSGCPVEEWDWECEHPCTACLECADYGAYIILARTPARNADSLEWHPVYPEACPVMGYCWIVHGIYYSAVETICRCPNE